MLDAEQVQQFARASSGSGPGFHPRQQRRSGPCLDVSSASDEAWTEELHLKFFSVLHPHARLSAAQLGRTAKAGHRLCELAAGFPAGAAIWSRPGGAALRTWCAPWPLSSRLLGVRVNGILVGLIESGQWRRRF